MRYGLNTELNKTMNSFMKEKESDYRKRIFLWDEDLPIRDFCGDYGMTTRKMNKWLQEHGIQYRANGEWIPKPALQRRGYVICGFEEFRGRTGYVYPSSLNYWTPEGRAFLYDYLKAHGVLPLEEREIETKERQEESAYA